MTLLDASVHLIDAARQVPENKVLERAIKRMERRVQVLRLRAARARRRGRHKAWWNVMWTYVGGFAHKRAVIDCPGCKVWIDFGHFASNAEIDGRGYVKSWECGKCGYNLAKNIQRHPDRNLGSGLL